LHFLIYIYKVKKNLFTVILLFSAYAANAQSQWAASGNNMYNTNTGNVGIGTSNPQAKLSLSNDITSQKLLLYESVNTRYGFGIQNAELRQFSASDGHISFGTISNSDGSSWSEKMRVDNTGNVGIGTTAPGALLDVGKTLTSGQLGSVLGRLNEGNAVGAGTYLGIKGYDTQPGEIYSSFNDVKSFAIEHSFYGVTNSSVSFLRGGGQSGGSISFSTGANVETMRIIGNGYVGIGTTTPDSRLAVNGTIHAKEVKVDLVGWPDYVFSKTYRLPLLSEIKTYIDLHQHLSGMPSASEAEKNGISLGAMNKVLTQKVEELTLYLLEKEKERLGQEKRLNALEEQVKALTLAIKK
jgi:hypothetical protein